MYVEPVSIASDIAIGVSALAVAIVAFFGLRTWRKELTGKAKFDIARNVILLGSKLRANFEWVRWLSTPVWESAERPRKNNESSGESQVLDEWYAKSHRLQPLIENLRKLQELSWQAQVLLSEDSSKCVEEVFAVYRSSYADLASAIDSYFRTRYDEAKIGSLLGDQDWLQELHKKIYGIPDDDFSKQINDATKRLAPALKVYVK